MRCNAVAMNTYERMGKSDVEEVGIDRLVKLEEAMIRQQKWLRFLTCLLFFSTSLIIANSTVLLPTLYQPFVVGKDTGTDQLKNDDWKHEVSRIFKLGFFILCLRRCRHRRHRRCYCCCFC